MFRKNNTKITKFVCSGLFFLFTFFILNATNINEAEAATPSDLYRFWSDTKQGHFYTASTIERDQIIATYPQNVWKYEGVAFQVFTTPETGTIPVYRFWSDLKQGHFYTASEDEKNQVDANYPDNVWRLEGIAWYAYASEQPGSAPVYRFWSDEKQHHFFTYNTAEKTCVQNSYTQSAWGYEGVAYWTPGIAPADNPDATCGASLGPIISVGVWSYVRDDIRSTTGEPFKIDANKNYVIKKEDGTIVASLLSTQQTRVAYESAGNLQIYSNDAGIPLTSVGSSVSFESADDANSDIIFDAHRPSTPTVEYDSYNHYRGRIELRYTDNSKNSSIYQDGINQRIWVINKLPLEQYTWGMGELNAANISEHNNVMVTIFRTYGKSKTEIATQYNQLGFDVLSTPASQKYNGYDYEVSRPGIKNAAIATRGKIVTYNGKTALTAYSSWSDGTTRALDLDLYPYLKPVDDPYGNYNGEYWDNPQKSSTDLITDGNHMRGLIAWGSVTMAYNLKWDWQRILKYYYTGVDLTSIY